MDLGIRNFIQVIKNLKNKSSFGPVGKLFEEQIMTELSKNGFISSSFEQQNNNLKEIFNLENNQYTQIKKDIRSLVLNKKNIEPISNIFKNFIQSDIYIHIYINHLVVKTFLTS